MLHNRLEQWQSIETISEKIWDRAESIIAAEKNSQKINQQNNHQTESWQEIILLDIDRRQKLETFFSAELTSEENSFIKPKLNLILYQEKKLYRNLQSVQSDLCQQFQFVGNHHRAAVAYDSVQAN